MAKEGSYSDHHFPVLLYSNGEDNRLLTEDQALVFMIANNVSDLDVREVSTVSPAGLEVPPTRAQVG